VALLLLAGWSLFAFAGAYFWTTVPLAAGALVLGAWVRPSVGDRERWLLDFAIVVALVVAGFQLVPLPARARAALSPAAVAVDRALRFDASIRPAALTVDPEATAEAIVVMTAVALVFWSARAIFDGRSPRRTIFGIAMYGMAASAIGLAQHLTSPRLLYWIWQPVNRSAMPFTPFVNRNDLAGWLIMGLPLAAGYMLARLDERRREGLVNVERVLDPTGVWLSAAICVMTAGLVSTLSRSGLMAAAAAAIALVLLSRGRLHGAGRAWLIAGVGFVSLIAIAYVNVGALMTRVGETVSTGVGGRREIWLVTAGMIRDFWLAGVGVGAYPRAMSVYQPPHVFSFNHAHDEYLQILSEGGVLLTLPALVAAIAGGREIARQLRADRTPSYWMRAGATSALVAAAVQAIWETTIHLPANAVLFALCAAVAMHRRSSHM